MMTEQPVIDRGRMLAIAVAIWILVSIGIFTAGPFQTLINWGNDTYVLDMRGGYSHETAVGSLTNFGLTGRQLYTKHLVLDTIYVLVQSVTISWLMLFTIRRLRGANSNLQWMIVVPVIIGCLDLIENVAIAGMLATFPSIPAWIAHLASAATAIKLSGVVVLMICLAATMLGLITLAVKRARQPQVRLRPDSG